MNRINKQFEILKASQQKALITYITAGDPDISTTKQLVLEMDKNGADIIEIGIPYSDPVADGPVIQRAAQRALDKGTKIKDVMQMILELRKHTQVPFVYLVYFNCILQYGVEKFIADCKEVGVDGLVIPDLPFEESNEIREIAKEWNIIIISLIAPTSKDRVQKIASQSQGFIYCVSSTGVTGTRNRFDKNLAEFIGEIGKYSTTPKAIGFGISSPDHIKKLKDYCDGLIVGSAIIKNIEENIGSKQLVEQVGIFIRDLKKALSK